MPKKGYKQTKEHKTNNAEARRGKWHQSGEFKKNMSIRVSGDGNPAKLPGVGLRISKAKEGHIVTKETRRKIKEKLIGYKHSEEVNKKKGRKDNKHWNWQNGVSREPYGVDFSLELKLEVRQRDDFTCQFCGTIENGRAHDVHHIDYDKKDNNKTNLITLCQNHNRLANYNKNKWQFLFQTLQEIRSAGIA